MFELSLLSHRKIYTNACDDVRDPLQLLTVDDGVLHTNRKEAVSNLSHNLNLDL